MLYVGKAIATNPPPVAVAVLVSNGRRRAVAWLCPDCTRWHDDHSEVAYWAEPPTTWAPLPELSIGAQH